MYTIKDVGDSINAINKSIMMEETKEGNALMDEATRLTQEMFLNNTDIHANRSAQLDVLERQKEFEDKVINLPIMNWFYASIARTSLNTKNFNDAFMYAKAGIELCEKNNDPEGVNANRVALLDAACFMGSFKNAVKMIEEHPEIASPKLLAMFKLKPSKNDKECTSLLKSAKRPKSLKFCLDEVLCAQESRIRFTMRQMHVSRKTAIKYIATANEYKDRI